MLTIGELAELAGTTTRTVRHYHAVGVLPEPTRRANGYRQYDLPDAVRLVRVRRLTELGLSLPEVRDVLQAAGGDGLREVLAELDADLARQQQALAERRRRLAELLAREGDPAVSDGIAGLLRELTAAVPEASRQLVAREREALELIEASSDPGWFAQAAERYRAALADPEQAAVAQALATRFEALVGAHPDDPEVAALARDLAAAGAGRFDARAGGEASWQPVWQALLAELAAAQRRCMKLAFERHPA